MHISKSDWCRTEALEGHISEIVQQRVESRTGIQSLYLVGRAQGLNTPRWNDPKVYGAFCSYTLLGCGQTLNHPSRREIYFTWFTNILIQHHSLPEASRQMLHHFPTLLRMLWMQSLPKSWLFTLGIPLSCNVKSRSARIAPNTCLTPAWPPMARP